MKCYGCGKDNPVICQILDCEVASCREEIVVALSDNKEEVSYSVLCPQHRKKISSVSLKLFEWEELIESKLKK